MSRFKESTDFGSGDGVYEINEEYVSFHGGGDFYDGDGGDPDADTWQKAQGLAEKYGMVISSGAGKWEGWSEYTPDPGDVSVFRWSPK